MNFGVLGPITVTYQGKDHAPTARKLRHVLSILLLKANTPVSVAQISDELWGASPPRTATAAVHTYIAQLRRTTGDRLVTQEARYALTLYPGELDLDVVRAELRHARLEQARGQYQIVSQYVRRALNRWRGPLLADVLPGPLLLAEIASVERLQREAIGLRIEADLQLGRHRELIGELSALVCRCPGDEGLARQLMVAFYRSGRQADAIAVFHRLRVVLRDMGGAPSAGTRELYSDIISASPALAGPAWKGPPAGPAVPGLTPPPATAGPGLADGAGSALRFTPGVAYGLSSAEWVPRQVRSAG